MTSSLDRIAPTRRPDLPVAGTQRWRELLFLHWSVPREALRRLVPASLELDDHEGELWVGLVPFVMQGIRSSWMPRPLGLDFLETNLRTYVHHRGRPGVYFFSLEASSFLAVEVARAVWKLPYEHARMSTRRSGDTIHYESRRKRDPKAMCCASYTIGEPIGPSTPGSFEYFLLERYLLFSERSGRLYEGQVHHAPYFAHRVELASVEEGLFAAAGIPATAGPPQHAHYSPGVDVEVFGPWPAGDR